MYLNGTWPLPFEGFNEWEGILTSKHLFSSSPDSYTAKLQVAKEKENQISLEMTAVLFPFNFNEELPCMWCSEH